MYMYNNIITITYKHKVLYNIGVGIGGGGHGGLAPLLPPLFFANFYIPKTFVLLVKIF